MNFNHLGLKKLICTCYANSPISYTELKDLPLFNEQKKLPYMIEITEVSDYNQDGAEDMADIEHLIRNNKNTLTILDGDGDFRSEESIEFLKEADIVVTNPPFSLFREFISQLMRFNKHFVVLGNMNAITYKEIFPLIKTNKLWVGYGFNKSIIYKTPYPNLLESNRKYVLSKGKNPDDGYVKVPAICWFTNLDIQRRHDKLVLYKKYDVADYPTYDNFDAINVDRVLNIPDNYYDMIGVPITFLDKYNPDQFEIVALGTSRDHYTPNKKYKGLKTHKPSGKVINGAPINSTLALKVTNIPEKGEYYTDEYNNIYIQPYARIIIRRKNEN